MICDIINSLEADPGVWKCGNLKPPVHIHDNRLYREVTHSLSQAVNLCAKKYLHIYIF